MRPLLTCAAICLLAIANTSPLVARDAAVADDAAAQLFLEAQTAREERRLEDAVGAYHRVVAEHPASTWTSRALIESATCLVALGRWSDAMRQLQGVRAKQPSDPEAAMALARNTILYRLHLRGGQPTYRYAPGAGMNTAEVDLRRLAAIAIDDENRVYFATRKTLHIYDERGTVIRSLEGDDQRALFLREGTFAIADEKTLRLEARTLPVTAADASRTRDVEIQAAAAMAGGDILIADRKSKSIVRIGGDGTFRGRFAQADVVRLAVSPFGDAAAIERDTRAVLLIDKAGATRTLAASGTGYAMRAPVDLAFDVFGHLYVLERDRVVVFAPTGEPLTTFAPGAAGRGVIGGFQSAAALGVDGAGRLYVLDADAQRIQVYH